MSTPPPTSPQPPLPPHPHSSNTSITIILTITLLIFFIIGFFALYFCKCFIQRFCRSWRLRNSPSGTPVGPAGAVAAAQGLDPAIIKAFPSFTYSTVKEYRREKYGLECAICLCEFQDSDILRLLTSCCHVFHQDCIDLWLESHTSCPVCRRTLEAPEVYAPSPDVVSIHMQEEASSDHSVRITIQEDDEREHKGDSDNESQRRNEVNYSDALQEAAPGTSGGGENNKEQDEEEEIEVEKFSRSKTTGHSIVKKKQVEGNKYTLILPDHVRAKLLRGHNATRSETTFGEFKSKTTTGNGGFGEVSELSRGDDNNV